MKPTKEHPSVKSKRMDSLSDFKKSFLINLFEDNNVFEIQKHANELGVTYYTLFLKIRYWHFEKCRNK